MKPHCSLVLAATVASTLWLPPQLGVAGVACCLAAEGKAEPAGIELVGTQTVKELPKFGDSGFDYTDSCCAFLADKSFQCIHPLKSGGEWACWIPTTGKVQRLAIPQPEGFEARFDFKTYFSNSALWTDRNGGCLIRWELEGNGDHGLALRKKPDGPFATARVKIPLANSKAVTGPDGAWYLLVWEGSVYRGFDLSVFALDDQLRLKPLGKHHSSGHHSIGVVDAAFPKEGQLHVMWANVEPTDNWLRMLTIDLDVQKKTWSEEQEILRVDRFVSWVKPAVILSKGGIVHYFWWIDEGQKKTDLSGLYYQGKGAGEPIKLAVSRQGFKATGVGDKLVVCYTLEDEPDKAYFRVIEDGKAGPALAVTLAHPSKHALWDEDYVLGTDADGRVWFVDTLDIDTLYELKIVTDK
jgi:hypothetical protein